MSALKLLDGALKEHLAPYLQKRGFVAQSRSLRTCVRERTGLLQQVWIVPWTRSSNVHLGVACHLLFDSNEKFDVYGPAGRRVDGAWHHETQDEAAFAARELLKAVREQEKTFFGKCASAADYRDLCTLPSDRQYVLCEIWLKRYASARRALDNILEQGWGGSIERRLLAKLKEGSARSSLEATYKKNARAFRLS